MIIFIIDSFADYLLDESFWVVKQPNRFPGAKGQSEKDIRQKQQHLLEDRTSKCFDLQVLLIILMKNEFFKPFLIG